MKDRNRCYTYFSIVGDFDPREATELLGLRPDHTVRAGERSPRGILQSESVWEFGRCDKYSPITADQMERTLLPLAERVEQLRKFREEHSVKYYLSVVPELYCKDAAPALAPSLNVIDFCHAVRCEIDIDMYLCEGEDVSED